MLKSLYAGASGMHAQQMSIDTIANNLANVNTNGFKKSTMEFQDLIYQTIRAAGSKTGDESQTPTELQVGGGVKPVATNKSFSQGDVVATDTPLDVAIIGEGFFKVLMENGQEGFTRDGHFKISAEGSIVTNDGYLLEPQIDIPEDTEALVIGDNGVVSVKLSGEASLEEVGQFELQKFINPAGLKSIGQNLFQVTPASGEAVSGTPLSTGFGKLAQSYIEKSNVNLVQEMVSMISTQRAYELNSKTIQTADQMLQKAVQIKR